jgi:glycosyltransferase involved in cell wall biosynthesis
MLVNHLRKNGVIVAVVAPRDHTQQGTLARAELTTVVKDNISDLDLGPVAQRRDDQVEVRISGYPLPFNPELTVVYPVRLSALYRRAFGDNPPDIIYLASPASIGFQVMLQLRQHPAQNQVPVICNFQTDLAGYCSILFPFPLSTIAAFAFDKVQSFLFRHSSVKTIFYPSRFVRRYLERTGVAVEKMEMVQRGVDTMLFNPCQRSESFRVEIAPHGEIVLVCVARLAGEKGFDFLATVARELDERGLRFKLCIIGGNRNAAVEAEVRAMFSQLVRRGKVVFLGFRVGKELATAYASADLFLHCSVTETFGLVVLESMASGVPVVARDEGGPSDIIRDGHNGYLVAATDLSGFVDKVLLLAKDSHLRTVFSKHARQHAERSTWEEINNKIARTIADTIRIAARDPEQCYVKDNGRERRDDQGKEESAREPLLAHHPIRSEIVKTNNLGSLTIISAFWVAVGGYLVFIKVMLWVKAGFTPL